MVFVHGLWLLPTSWDRWAANASFKQQQDNPGVTEIVEIPDRGHALVIDHGRREVADKALGFVKRFV